MDLNNNILGHIEPSGLFFLTLLLALPAIWVVCLSVLCENQHAPCMYLVHWHLPSSQLNTQVLDYSALNYLDDEALIAGI